MVWVSAHVHHVLVSWLASDGFVAGPGGDMALMSDFVGPNAAVDELPPRIGAALMGHRTYQGAKTEEARLYGGAWTGQQFV
jgi:hypothetical protein